MSNDSPGAREAVDDVGLPLNLVIAEIEKLGRIIEDLRSRQVDLGVAPPSGPETGLVAVARSIYRLRRIREEVFGPSLFSDPSWDILLDLYIAAEKGKKVSVSSACVASASPATTALRHLSALVKYGLVSRQNSDVDSRVVWVELTHSGHDKVTAVLSAWIP